MKKIRKQERALLWLLDDRYDALTNFWPHRLWDCWHRLNEPGILVKTNPNLFLK
jgi:hypothetical protein